MKKIEEPTDIYKENLPILSVMNRDMYGVIRWCTPSIHPRVPKVNGIYETDMSISFHSLGNPSMNTGIFKKAHELAAKAYKSQHTLFSVNGSSGSNFMVFRALSHQLKTVHMLAQRNVHKSVTVSIEDYHLNVNYLTPHYDDILQIFIPNTIEEFEKGLRDHPETNLVFISNPTYEGLSIDLYDLVLRLRKIKPDVIIYVDEAWGSLFPFSDRMPTSAMEAGADVCVQSTHKQGSGLQQTSMIHWQGKRISSECIMESYSALITTSPSFHLLASLDAARYLMATQGKEIINDLLSNADILKAGLAEIEGFRVIEPKFIKKEYKQVADLDRTKILVNVKKSGIPGYEIAKSLESNYKVLLEKYEADNIFFISILQNTQNEALETIKRVKACVKKLAKQQGKARSSFPKFPIQITKAMPAPEVLSRETKVVKLEDAAGKICAEYIVPYPPGIPLVGKGEVIRDEHIEYLQAIRDSNGLMSCVMADKTIQTITVVV